MDKSQTISTAIISTDRDFTSAIREAVAEAGHEVVTEIAVSLDELNRGHLEQISHADSNLLIIDIDENPENGFHLAQMVLEANPALKIFAASATQSPKLFKAAMRAGVSEYLTKPVDAEDVLEAIAGIQPSMENGRQQTPRKGQVFAFVSTKGGAGTTTVATNTAAQIQRQTGKKTVLVDFGLELGEVAHFVGVRPRFNVVDLAENLHRMDEELLPTYIVGHESGLGVLAAPMDPTSAEKVSFDQIRPILQLLRKHYDYVIVDAARINGRSIRILDEADRIFFVAEVNIPTIKNMQRCTPVLRQLGKHGDAVHLIVNRFDPENEISLSDVEEALDLQVYWTLSNDYSSVLYSINTGNPMVMNGDHGWTDELEGLVAKITGVRQSENGQQGWTSRLRNPFAKQKRSSSDSESLFGTPQAGGEYA